MIEQLLPGICILVGAYITARIMNRREAKKIEAAYIKRESDRRNKVDALYGRKK